MTAVLKLLWLSITLAAAQAPPPIPCGGLSGCGNGGAANVLAESVLPQLGQIMLGLAGALAVLFIVFAGFQIFLAGGEQSKFDAGKQAITYTLLGLGIAGLSQVIVGMVLTEPTVASVTDEISAVAAGVEFLLNLVNGVFIVVIGYAGIRMLVAQGRSEKYDEARSIITQAITGAVIVNLAHAFVRIVTSFLGI
jgi:hypothetical protein